MNQTAKSSRLNAIELVRFVGALGILTIHFGKFYFENSGYFSKGYLFVEYFFILTGFYMMRGLDREGEPLSTPAFLLRKIKGFYAPLCVALCGHLLYDCIYQRCQTVGAVLDKLFHFKWEFLLLSTAGFIDEPQINQGHLMGQTWYLSAMVIALVFAYPLARFYRRAYLNLISPLFILCVYSFMVQTFGGLDYGNVYVGVVILAVLRGFAGISVGALTYAAWKALSERGFTSQRERRAAVWVEIAAWAMLVLALIFGRRYFAEPGVIMIPVFTCLVVLANLNQTPVSCWLNGLKPGLFGFLGKFSLYLYLVHWTPLMIVKNFLPNIGTGLSCLLVVGGSLVYAGALMAVDRCRKGVWPIAAICGVLAAGCFMVPFFF